MPGDVAILWERILKDRRFSLQQKPASGHGEEKTLKSESSAFFVSDISPEGRYILFQDLNPDQTSDLWYLAVNADKNPVRFTQARRNEIYGQFSPDGRWVAYASNETGRYEVYIESFPGQEQRLQASQKGGASVHWRRDGKKLFYIALDKKLMAVEIEKIASQLRVDTPKELFQTNLDAAPQQLPARAQYDVSPDGQRFLINTAESPFGAPINVVLNWPALLKR